MASGRLLQGPSRPVQCVETCLPRHGALHQLPAGPNLRLRGDPHVSEVNKLSLQRLGVIDARARPRFLPPRRFSFLRPRALLPSLDPDANSLISSCRGRRGETRARLLCVAPLIRDPPPAKLSLLSANFTTCAKLKALMRKRSVPLVSPCAPPCFLPIQSSATWIWSPPPRLLV